MTRHVEPATLVAYLDGELTPAAAGQVEAALAADPELRAWLASLERADTAPRSAFDPILEAPLPSLALTERPRLGAVPVEAAGNRRPAARVAWAAGLAGLVVGFAAGQLGPTLLPPAEPAAVAAIESQLPEVLETELSGTTVALEESSQGVSGTVRAISTFVNADGRYCRTYEARVAAEEGRLVSRGVACRDEDGRWLTRVQVNAV
jgi:anti-sigma factor RsiW